ncbi:MAG: NAD(P)-binding protein, partial [Deltaproteobacteria bacterium]|nr:NAD(P)-binding protein [Deltaproteobacteria bacterium]
MEQEDLRELENRCIQECAPWCTAQCPVHVDVQAMLAAVSAGDFAGAAGVFRKKVPFAGIVSHVCDHPCQDVCRRTAVDATVSIRSVERAALYHGFPKKISIGPLPGEGKKVAVVGAGLSGLTAALELTSKGHTIVLFEASFSLGGSVWDHPKTSLPRKVIQEDFEIVRNSPIRIHYGTVLGREFTLSDLEEDFDAVYLGIGTGFTWSEQIEKDEIGRVKADPITFQTGRSAVFAAGGPLAETGRRSEIRSISDGRRAAVSIDRFLKKVSLTASRENEGVYETRLFTSVEGIEPKPPVATVDPRGVYAPEEAMSEAARCLQCECMECVKVCEYLAHYKGYPKKYVRQIYNNLSIVMGQRHGNKFINSCSLCG